MVLLLVPSPASSTVTPPSTGQSIPLVRDEFDDSRGEFANYDCYDSGQRTALHHQRHVDLFAFDNTTLTIGYTMDALSNYGIPTTNTLTMAILDGALESDPVYETWTGIGAWSVTNRALSVPLQTSTVVITATPNAPLDLDTDFQGTDFISCGLPALPNQIDTANTFIDFTSNADGDFGVGPTDSVSLSASLIPLVSGANSEFRIHRATLVSVDLSAVTTVRFRVTGLSASGTITFTALRLLSADWRFAPIDYNTVTQRIERTIAPDGSGSPYLPTSAYGFNFPVVQGLPATVPTEFPALFRSAYPGGTNDPQPIDGSYVTRFKLSDPTNDGAHQVRFFFREQGLDRVLQLDLDETTGNVTPMAKLNSAGKQPDASNALFMPRPQSTLEGLTQGALDTFSQSDLELTSDVFSAVWIEASLTWAAGERTLFVGNELGDGYTFDLSPTDFTDGAYIMVTDVEDTSVQVRLYQDVDYLGDNTQRPMHTSVLGAPLFDSNQIQDDFIFPRRKGRVGWWAFFESETNKPCWLDYFRTNGLSFGEYRSHPLKSFTPVVGLSLSSAYTGDRQLITAVTGKNGAAVAVDPTRSTSGLCYRVTGHGGQGLITNQFVINHTRETILEFDLLYPTTADELDVYLVDSQGTLINLDLSITTTTFEHHRLTLPRPEVILPGYFSLVINKSTSGTITWWIDNLHVRERSVIWDARATTDAWGDLTTAWLPFSDTANKLSGGVLFEQSSTQAHVRARATQQVATITQLKITPKYAEPGRLVWPEEAVTSKAPVAGISYTQSGGDFVFSGYNSTSGQQIISYYWFFGDGEIGSGPVVSHSFTAGTYYVTLIVVDTLGTRDTVTQLVVAT